MRRPGLRANRHRWNPRWMSLESNRVVDARRGRGRRPTRRWLPSSCGHGRIIAAFPDRALAAGKLLDDAAPLFVDGGGIRVTWGAVGDSGAASAGRLL
jgi:hypothetical protein